MRNKVVGQKKDRVFNGKGFISMTIFLTLSRQACVSTRIQHSAVVWLFPESIKSPAITAIQAWFRLSSNAANRCEVTIKIYAEMVNHLLRCYATVIIIAKTDEENRSFKHGLLRTWVISAK